MSFYTFNSRINFSIGFSLTTTVVLIRLTRSAKRNVLNVSSKLTSAGDKAAIITVLLFPPKAFWSNFVNTDSRYGTTIFRFEPDDISANADITFPNVDNDLFIFVLSFNRSPVAPVLAALSDPLKLKINLIFIYKNSFTS